MIEDGKPLFRFALFEWNVARAKQVRKGTAPDYHVAVKPLLQHIALWNRNEEFIDAEGQTFIRMGLVQIDPLHAITVSLDEPLYSVTIPLADCGGIVIDGWERIYRASLEGVTSLPCYHFRDRAEAAIRIRPTDRDLADLYPDSALVVHQA